MAQTTITMTVDTVKFKNGDSDAITMSQTGRIGYHDDYSEVCKGDDIIWCGVAVPLNPPSQTPIINIDSLDIPPNFGPPLPGSPPATGGGNTVTRAADNLMDTACYWINFSYPQDNDVKQFKHDPKIKISAPSSD